MGNSVVDFYAIIILFNPKDDSFLKIVRSLLNNGIRAIVYDNSTAADVLARNRALLFSVSSEIEILDSSGKNLGLSYAFFDTIERLKEKFPLNSGIFFFDQDSEVTDATLIRLISSYKKMLLNSDFGMVCGMPIRKDSTPYRIRAVNAEKENNEYVEVSRVPISFALIPLKTFITVGNFERDFFIDFIDNNFCQRCVLKGLKIFVDLQAPFIHDVGLGDVMFLGFKFPFSTPDRHYYQIRNRILSQKRLVGSKLILFKELIFRTMVIAIIGVKKRDLLLRFKYVFQGLKDGFNSVSGKYDNNR